jgi:lipopolysaccharide/colanic/teichoic acid biosynthesis glycosyltransferase
MSPHVRLTIAAVAPSPAIQPVLRRRNGTAVSIHTRLVPLSIPRWKRLLDLVLVSLFAAVWLPLIVVISYGIKVISPGPVFFRQRRIGLGGRPFMIVKFRSMRVNAETTSHERYLQRLMESNEPMAKLDPSDRRLIPLGHLLRASGLDELPQIFNVLRGEMSLVGPRPCTEVEYACYKPSQSKRVKAPPGLTGYWQVHGKNKTTFNRMIAMDRLYAQRMSLPLDLNILARTLPVLFRETFGTLIIRWRSLRLKQQISIDQTTANSVTTPSSHE